MDKVEKYADRHVEVTKEEIPKGESN